jgi:rubrerythrin
MSQPEPEPVEQPEPDDADDADEEAQEEETAVEQPSADEPEPEARAAKSEKEIEKATKALESEANRHAGRVSAIMGDDAILLEVCPRCWPSAPGFIFALDQMPVEDEQRAAVLASLGMGANTGPDLRMAKGVEECPVCGGWGELALPSKSEFHQKMICSACSGNGYITIEAEKPAWTPQPLDPSAFAVGSQYGGNGAQPDQWGRPFGHPHYGQDPAYVGV